MSTGQVTHPARTGLILRGAAALGVLVLLATLAGQAMPTPTGPAFSLTPATAAPASWAKVTLPADGAVADIQPTRPLGQSVATTTSFSVHSLGPVAAVDLASAVTADPPITFTVEPGATPGDATITPTSALAPGVRYRFRVEAPDGSLAGTWTFRTASPLHVVGRLPDEQSSNVPINTGIETTFDQDGPTDFAAHFTIAPAVAGRFEQHGRTWAFIPRQPLAPLTIYTVTVSHGVGLQGSDQVLETDVRWQFETASTDAAAGPRVFFQRPVLEVRPGLAPALAVSVDTNEDGTSAVTSAAYELYQLPTLQTASAAALKLVSRPSWADWPASQLVDTSGLRRVASGTAPLTLALGLYFGIDSLQLPVKPEPGWYLVVLPNGNRPAQAILQVTDLAAYVLTSQTRTTAWVNDLATQSPVAGASVDLVGGASLGRTGSDGLSTVATPGSLVNQWSDSGSWSAHLLTITAPDGRTLLAPLGMDGGGYPADDNRGVSTDASEGWWLLLSTDRSTYRQSDTVHAWGVVKARRDGSVPADLELRLGVPNQPDVPIVRLPVTATSRGVFSGDLAFRGLPTGQYEVSLYSGSDLLRSFWVEIAVIRKPAYTIAVTTDRHAYLRGDAIAVAGNVAFYDGSHAPGLSLSSRFDSSDAAPGVAATTAADGAFQLGLPGSWDPEWGTSSFVQVDVGVHSTGPEEGTIAGSAPIVIFPSAAWLDASATLVNGHVQLTGRLTAVDFARVEAQMAGGQWPTDPSGAALAGRTVTARVVHHVPVKRQIGTSYDFITKHVRPLYDYTERLETLTTQTLTAGSDGRLSLDVAVPVASDQYEVDLTARDAAGRVMTAQAWAGQSVYDSQPSRPYLVAQGGCGYGAQVKATIGSTSDLTVYEGDGSVAGDGRYLFLVGENGLVSEAIQSSSTYRRTFVDADLPSYSVRAVRLTDHGYDAMVPLLVRVDPASKTLGVSVTPLASRYAPGDTASVRIRTTDAAGRPVAADVIVRAVDEKLFTIGAAVDVDALGELLVPRDSGFLQSYTSHPTPFGFDGGCGGTGGGGRDDFRDAATFQRVQTDANGLATVSFRVPDDLTSWHVSATAVSAKLDAGSGSALVPVGLPFFVDAILAPEYLAGETPALLVRAYGDATALGDPVRFVVRAPDLGIEQLVIEGRVGTMARAQLPALTPGDHRVTIEGYASNGTLTDALVRTVHVVPTRLNALRITQHTLATWTAGDGGSGLTTYLVTDAGRASLLPILRDILGGDGARFDQAAAADAARTLLIDELSIPAGSLPGSTYDRARYTHVGVTLLPYSSPDLTLTALAAVAAPAQIDAGDARYALSQWIADGAMTRERTIIALAAQAALGVDVLDQLRAMASDSLSIREQIWLGIGYLASGDETSARAIERQVLAGTAERLDPWVRLAVPGSEATLEATALMLVLSGGLGDPLAVGMARYVQSQPTTEQVFSLQLLAYVRGGLDRLTRAAASFAWTVDGTRHEQTIEPGGAFDLTLTSDQRSSLHFERLAGDPVITTAWIGDAATSELPATPGLAISRTVSPAIGAADGIVTVQIGVSFAGSLPTGCYNVTDLLPSGLAPLLAVPGWSDDAEVPRSAEAPYAADGQRVSWCVSPDSKRSFLLAYRARVVTPGTYRWEPAVIQSTTAPSLGASTPATTYVIR